jgi:hypothetical protein
MLHRLGFFSLDSSGHLVVVKWQLATPPATSSAYPIHSYPTIFGYPNICFRQTHLMPEVSVDKLP